MSLLTSSLPRLHAHTHPRFQAPKPPFVLDTPPLLLHNHTIAHPLQATGDEIRSPRPQASPQRPHEEGEAL